MKGKMCAPEGRWKGQGADTGFLPAPFQGAHINGFKPVAASLRDLPPANILRPTGAKGCPKMWVKTRACRRAALDPARRPDKSGLWAGPPAFN